MVISHRRNRLVQKAMEREYRLSERTKRNQKNKKPPKKRKPKGNAPVRGDFYTRTLEGYPDEKRLYITIVISEKFRRVHFIREHTGEVSLDTTIWINEAHVSETPPTWKGAWPKYGCNYFTLELPRDTWNATQDKQLLLERTWSQFFWDDFKKWTPRGMYQRKAQVLERAKKGKLGQS